MLVVSSQVGPLGPPASRAATLPEHLELHEIRRLQLPEGRTPRSASILGADRIVVLFASELRILLWTDSVAKWLDLPTNTVPLAVRPTGLDSSPLEVLLSQDGRVAVLSGTGRIVGEHRISMPLGYGPIRDITGTSRGWVVGSIDSAGDLHVFALSQGQDPRRLLTFYRSTVAPQLPDSAALVRVHLTEVCDGMVAATLWWAPFTTSIVGLDGDMKASLHEESGPLTDLLGDRDNGSPGAGSLLVSMPVVEIPSGFIRTVANLGSTDRWVVVYDADGIRRRARSLPVPMAFVAGRPSEGLLLGAIQAPNHELILYGISEDTGTKKGVCK